MRLLLAYPGFQEIVVRIYFPVDGGPAHSGAMRLGSVPYVSHQPGAYSRLLLAVYVLEIGAVWALPAGRGGHLHISAGRCGPMILIAVRVRAPALSVTAGLCGHA